MGEDSDPLAISSLTLRVGMAEPAKNGMGVGILTRSVSEDSFGDPPLALGITVEEMS